ncbi:MAG: CPBP family intramembrane metalloprotease [Spirochaetales bacterium]|nr:CPBP family intramembrane metalloprotease [Spirochaetales bacterium]
MEDNSPNQGNRKPYNWKLLLILVIAIFITNIMVTPYSLSLQTETSSQERLPLPLIALIPLQWLGNTILYGILAAVGLLIAGRIGMGLPFMESILTGKADYDILRRFILPAVIAGIVSAILLLFIDAVVFTPHLAPLLTQTGIKDPSSPLASPPVWAGFLASFYGGITEEILLRLFLLSFFAWIIRFIDHTHEGRPGMAALWIANILAAVLFGLGHLPATAAAGLPLNALVITRAIVLNGIIGVVCGWFYWTYGLESSIVSHFSADLVLHVIWPLFGFI